MKKQYEFTIHKEDAQKGNILIGIPRERVYIPLFVDNRDALLNVTSETGRLKGYYQAEGHRVDRNREDISEYFMNHPDRPEWLLMLDTDMEHPTDAAALLTRWNKPIVGALYFHRGKKHDPFVFKRAEDRLDKYGRTEKTWAPMRDEVYEFLEACALPMRDGSIVISNPPINPLIECDAVATGCLVIHRSVFEQMEPPWWEYRAGGNSEDLIFCDEAKFDYGIPIYADLSVICGHYHWVPMGQAQFRTLYISFGLNSTNYTKATAVRWTKEFLDIPEEEAERKIEAGNAHVVGDYWSSKFKKSKPSVEEVEAFYKDPYVGELYLIELLHWNFTAVFHNIRQMILPLRDKNVLEIGGGIGTVASQLVLQNNRVVTAEINPFLREFIEYRWKWYEDQLIDVKGELYITDDSWTKEAEDEQFDAIVSFDTFEHLPAEPLQQLLKDMWRVLKPGGKLYYHANFGQQDLYPLHYDHSELWDSWLIQNGFIPDTPVLAYKGKTL